MGWSRESSAPTQRRVSPTTTAFGCVACGGEGGGREKSVYVSKVLEVRSSMRTYLSTSTVLAIRPISISESHSLSPRASESPIYDHDRGHCYYRRQLATIRRSHMKRSKIKLWTLRCSAHENLIKDILIIYTSCRRRVYDDLTRV